MRVAVLDESADLESIAMRKGHWSEWFDAHVIETLREAGHEVSLVQWRADAEGMLAEVRAAYDATLKGTNLDKTVRDGLEKTGKHLDIPVLC